MKKILNATAFSSILILLLLTSCATSKPAAVVLPDYHPQSPELFAEIQSMDSAWQEAYNQCKLDAMRDLISEDLEFYHDETGLMKSKAQLILALENNICGKVSRELLPGSLEVYAIKGYGAVEIGYHRFKNQKEPGTPSHYSRFVHIWHNEDGHWRISRVISLH